MKQYISLASCACLSLLSANAFAAGTPSSTCVSGSIKLEIFRDNSAKPYSVKGVLSNGTSVNCSNLPLWHDRSSNGSQVLVCNYASGKSFKISHNGYLIGTGSPPTTFFAIIVGDETPAAQMTCKGGFYSSEEF